MNVEGLYILHNVLYLSNYQNCVNTILLIKLHIHFHPVIYDYNNHYNYTQSLLPIREKKYFIYMFRLSLVKLVFQLVLQPGCIHKWGMVTYQLLHCSIK